MMNGSRGEAAQQAAQQAAGQSTGQQTSRAAGLSITTGELAGLTGAALRGDPGVALTGAAALDTAGPGDLSFVRDGKFAAAAAESRAAALLVTEGVELGGSVTCPVLVVPDAEAAMMAILAGLRERRLGPEPAGVHPAAVVDPSAVVGEGVTVGPKAVIERGVHIGEGTTIGPGAVLAAGTTIGRRCSVGPNSTIGSEGFGYNEDPSTKRRTRIPHAGAVVIEDDVDIGANTAIDRGKLADTRIGRGTKIDNLVMIGHNCVIGEDCVICGSCGIAGSVTIGDRVIMAGQVGVMDNIEIVSDVLLMAKTGVTRSLMEPGVYIGIPVRTRKEFAGEVAALRRMARGRRAERTESHGSRGAAR
ncbi:MAG: UDP-3-O-(3-hydroxymyristoyl)glucosamine N-acyltransferase [Planctomycetota bacterium]